MKLIVRALVIALALTGSIASFHISAKAEQTSARATVAKTSAMPVPMCPPDDPNGCGIMGAGR